MIDPRKTQPNGLGATSCSTRIEVAVMLTQKKVHSALESLDWSGHVELPAIDLAWLAGQLSVRLNASGDAEVCDACNKVVPLLVNTVLGNICADCIEDFNDNIDQMREVMGDE
jgi:hypothetical protein